MVKYLGGKMRFAELKIKSSLGNKIYNVYLDEQGWHCECKGFSYRGACRHIKEATKGLRPTKMTSLMKEACLQFDGYYPVNLYYIPGFTMSSILDYVRRGMKKDLKKRKINAGKSKT